mmetsp:Transcript_30918/g.77329  ORF Transcript_30918/g.77329 Transcript_30918/m.77329 type:complete len:214 (-) Transcript_30918:109-750(-)
MRALLAPSPHRLYLLLYLLLHCLPAGLQATLRLRDALRPQDALRLEDALLLGRALRLGRALLPAANTLAALRTALRKGLLRARSRLFSRIFSHLFFPPLFVAWLVRAHRVHPRPHLRHQRHASRCAAPLPAERGQERHGGHERRAGPGQERRRRQRRGARQLHRTPRQDEPFRIGRRVGSVGVNWRAGVGRGVGGVGVGRRALGVCWAPGLGG